MGTRANRHRWGGATADWGAGLRAVASAAALAALAGGGAAWLAPLAVADARAQGVLPLPDEAPSFPEAPEPDAAPAPAAPADPAATPPLDERAARAAHLEELFARLADPDAEDWQAVEQQIWAAWAKSGSPSADLLLGRATRAMEAHDSDAAMAFLDDLVRLYPDYAEGWNKRATLHFILGDYGASVADIERVLALEPRHFGALAGLGIILDRLDRPEGAMLAYRRAIAIHPHLAGAAEGIERLAPDVDGRPL